MLVAQIRKSVRKKHTLPAYKLRYQPFFTMPSTAQGQAMPAPKDICVSGQRLNVGQLYVYVLNCTRLIQLSADGACVYCTVSVGNYTWILLALFICLLRLFITLVKEVMFLSWFVSWLFVCLSLCLLKNYGWIFPEFLQEE